MDRAVDVASCAFGPLQVDYDARVLTPRPWTLEQSEWAVEVAAAAGPGPILELCAGAGHIGLAAAVLAGRELVQVEVDPVAAGYARGNAARAGWAERVEIRTVALDRALRPEERFAVVIADPPYLPSADISRWPDDPSTAIDGGADGLKVLTACLRLTAAHLSSTGQLLLQVAGPAQAEQISQLLDANPGWGLCRVAVRVIDEERAVVLIGRITA